MYLHSYHVFRLEIVYTNMALVYRINVNLCPLLNTFYCKRKMNITRFKSQSNLTTKSEASLGAGGSNYTNFEKLIAYRQTQAHKSIIVNIQSFESVNNVEKFCSKYGKIVNIFPYKTFNNKCFVLIEFMHDKHVLEIRKIARPHTNGNEAIYSVSPMFIYKPRKNNIQQNISSVDLITSASQFAIPMLTETLNHLKQLKSVSNQMIKLHETLQVTELDIRLRFYTAEEITYYLSRLFVNVNVIPFGSSVNGFGQTGCDLDLLCTINNTSTVNENRRFSCLTQTVYNNDRMKQQQFLEVVHLLMTTCIPGVSNMTKILQARVPILKFTNLHTNMQCDLSSTNIVALYMSELLHIYGTMDKRVKPLVSTIRKWAQVNHITRDKPGHWITNFSLTLLVIFYLQTKGVLPSINRLKSEKNKQDYSKTFEFEKWKSGNKDDLEQLLFGFFEYYSNFNFKTQAICIRHATTREKYDNSAIFIYNPFDSSLNVGKNINLLELTHIIECFQQARYILVESSKEDGIVQLFKQKTNLVYNNNKQHSIPSTIQLQEESKLYDKNLLKKTGSNNNEKVKQVIK